MSRITLLRHYSGMTPMTMGWVGSKYPRYIVGWLGPAFGSSGLAVKSRPICPSVPSADLFRKLCIRHVCQLLN